MNRSEIAVSTISSVNFLTDVIVPLLSALIGVLMALFGVYITLKRDKNEHEQEQEEKACPFFTIPVSYTHLDVYKRQGKSTATLCGG